jgi:ribosomal protein L15
MKLNTLNVSLYKKGKRYGRGIGSGKGKTAGRGVLKGDKCLFIEDFLKEVLMRL